MLARGQKQLADWAWTVWADLDSRTRVLFPRELVGASVRVHVRVCCFPGLQCCILRQSCHGAVLQEARPRILCSCNRPRRPCAPLWPLGLHVVLGFPHFRCGSRDGVGHKRPPKHGAFEQQERASCMNDS